MKENLSITNSKLAEVEKERDLLSKQLQTTMPAVSISQTMLKFARLFLGIKSLYFKVWL